MLRWRQVLKVPVLTVLTVLGLLVLEGPHALERNEPRLVGALEPIRIRHHLPALGGAIVTSKGLTAIGVTGVRKAGTDVAVTPDDLWHLGSDTKAMTAAWIAQVVGRGKLSWGSTIGAVFPTETADAPEAFREITLLQLLSHRAGLIPNIGWQQASHAGATPREQRLVALKTASATPLASPPGTKYAYSNLGYVIAATMAERVVDRAWEQEIRAAVFERLGMTSCGFGGLGTPGTIDEPWPHTGNGQPTGTNGPLVDNPEVMGPAGTVHCSLGDWSKFVADQLSGLEGRGSLFSPATYAETHTAPFGGDYAFGWLVTDRSWGGGTVYTHAGSNTMNYAVVWMAPLKDFAVLVTTNQGGLEAQRGTDEAAAALIQLQQSAGTLPRRTDPLTGMEFVRIPAGSFEMGSPATEKDREAQEVPHRATIARPFYLGVHEVTQDEWTHVTGKNPANFHGCPACPVERINYADITTFVQRLNQLSSWPGFRLPSEAEWEYACRAGGTHAYGASDRIDRTRANVDGDRTKPVGSYAPNAWGLFDMSGNVWEWTSDDYAPYPGPAAPNSPSFEGEKKVIRGGSWRFGADSARCALRYTHSPQDKGYSLGVRLAHNF